MTILPLGLNLSDGAVYDGGRSMSWVKGKIELRFMIGIVSVWREGSQLQQQQTPGALAPTPLSPVGLSRMGVLVNYQFFLVVKAVDIMPLDFMVNSVVGAVTSVT